MSRYTGTHRPGGPNRSRGGQLVVLGVLMVAIGAGSVVAHATGGTASTGAVGSTRATTQPVPDPRAGGGATLAPTTASIRSNVATVALPVRLRIASIQVDTSLQPLGLQADGTLQAPSQWQVPGWFRDGVRPGSPGPAVIAGHVDSRSGPAVFYRLGDLRSGDVVFVTRADRSIARFVVDGIARYRKDSFPKATVYGPQPVPVLRLITCTGEFDGNTHSYLENLVVSAHLT